MENNLKNERWKQRLQNLNKAFSYLNEVVERYPNLSVLEKEGMIQRFEYTFELCWKTLKDFLESKDISEKYPRDVIKVAFQNELIEDGECWIEMLEQRNLFSHTYDEDVLEEATLLIPQKYFQAIKQVVEYLNKQ
jgi:nucleotidyltransferase substrate binding protein (TIGR01987 family)